MLTKSLADKQHFPITKGRNWWGRFSPQPTADPVCRYRSMQVLSLCSFHWKTFCNLVPLEVYLAPLPSQRFYRIKYQVLMSLHCERVGSKLCVCVCIHMSSHSITLWKQLHSSLVLKLLLVFKPVSQFHHVHVPSFIKINLSNYILNTIHEPFLPKALLPWAYAGSFYSNWEIKTDSRIPPSGPHCGLL